MRNITAELSKTLVVLSIAGLLVAPRAIAVSHSSSDAGSIRNCPAENWCGVHRTTDKAWRYSPLNHIDKDNVTRLRLKWIFVPGGSNTSVLGTPLAIDGSIYVATNPLAVWKLDGATGNRLWTYAPEMDEAVLSSRAFSPNRGLSIGDGRVYVGLADGRVVAIDENSGEILWHRRLVDSRKDIAVFSSAGIFVNSDLFVIGENGGQYPTGGRIFGLDPKSGEVKWRFPAIGRRDSITTAMWGGDSWKFSRDGTWQLGTVDYTNNQILTGTSSLSVGRNPDSSNWLSSGNVYTSSTVALDLDSGKLNWKIEESSFDPHESDGSPGEYILLEDEGRNLVLHPGNSGLYYIRETKSGEPVSVYPAREIRNWLTGSSLATEEWENMFQPDAAKRRMVCSPIDGGHSWNPGTYSPQTGLFYRVFNEWCVWHPVDPEGGGTTTFRIRPRMTERLRQDFIARGRIKARDPLTGEITWDKPYDIIPYSALMSTAGGLVFNATTDGFVEALDANNGATLWHFNNGTGHNGGIITYAAGGKQYVAVAAGHSAYVGRALADYYSKSQLKDYYESAAIVAFALP